MIVRQAWFKFLEAFKDKKSDEILKYLKRTAAVSKYSLKFDWILDLTDKDTLKQLMQRVETNIEKNFFESVDVHLCYCLGLALFDQKGDSKEISESRQCGSKYIQWAASQDFPIAKRYFGLILAKEKQVCCEIDYLGRVLLEDENECALEALEALKKMVPAYLASQCYMVVYYNRKNKLEEFLNEIDVAAALEHDIASLEETNSLHGADPLEILQNNKVYDKLVELSERNNLGAELILFRTGFFPLLSNQKITKENGSQKLGLNMFDYVKQMSKQLNAKEKELLEHLYSILFNVYLTNICGGANQIVSKLTILNDDLEKLIKKKNDILLVSCTDEVTSSLKNKIVKKLSIQQSDIANNNDLKSNLYLEATLEYYKHGNKETGYGIFLILGEHGHMLSLTHLARGCIIGDFFEKNGERAVYWFKRALECGALIKNTQGDVCFCDDFVQKTVTRIIEYLKLKELDEGDFQAKELLNDLISTFSEHGMTIKTTRHYYSNNCCNEEFKKYIDRCNKKKKRKIKDFKEFKRRTSGASLKLIKKLGYFDTKIDSSKISSSTDVSQYEYAHAVYLARREEYEQAYEKFTNLLARNNKEFVLSHCMLSLLLLHGKGVSRNLEKSVTHIKRAVSSGVVKSKDPLVCQGMYQVLLTLKSLEDEGNSEAKKLRDDLQKFLSLL